MTKFSIDMKRNVKDHMNEGRAACRQKGNRQQDSLRQRGAKLLRPYAASEIMGLRRDADVALTLTLPRCIGGTVAQSTLSVDTMRSASPKFKILARGQ